MKRCLFYFTILFLCLALHAQQIGNVFYYSQGEKVFLTERADIMFIKLKKDFDKQNLLSFIRADETVNLNTLDKEAFESLVILEAKEGKSFSLETLDKFHKNPNICSAHFLFENKNGKLRGVTDEFIIKLKSTTLFEQLQKLVAEYGCEIARENSFVRNKYVISVPKTSELNTIQMANLFYETELFEASKPNFIFFNMLTSNDPLFNEQWALKNTGQYHSGAQGIPGIDINVKSAWNITQGNSQIKVAIIDAGVDFGHEDIALNVLNGYDATTGSTTYPAGSGITLYDYHGTACAGIVAAIKDNNKGISGIAPYCKILPVRALIQHNCVGSHTNPEWLAAGIRWAYLNGADVISNSWFFQGEEEEDGEDIIVAINEAITFGRGDKGCVVVFSAGNEGMDTVYPQARLSNVIAVGSMNHKGFHAGSNYGFGLSIVAPSVHIITTYPYTNLLNIKL